MDIFPEISEPIETLGFESVWLDQPCKVTKIFEITFHSLVDFISLKLFFKRARISKSCNIYSPKWRNQEWLKNFNLNT